MEKEKSGVSTALFFALVTTLVATVSTSALAEKGGRGRHLGVPDVNLGLSKLHGAGAGAGPFVPAPAIHMAPGLVRGQGMTPPGHLATPGLRLGHSNGAMPAAPVSVQPGNGNGLAVGHRENVVDGAAQGTKQGALSASDQIAATSDAADRGVSQGNGAMPRQLPTCR